jgi:hypothetical protein
MMPIYTITTIPTAFPYKDSRCIGWFESCADAFNEVRNNSGDMYEEGHYRYAVIEEVNSGIYSFPRKEFWFEWSENRVSKSIPVPGYIILDKKPNRFNNVVCFSMG